MLLRFTPHRHLYLGRVAMVIMAVVGTLPLLADPKILNATTVSGTVVLGLGPPVYALMFIKGYRPLVFHLPFWTGVAFGVVFQVSLIPGYRKRSCNQVRKYSFCYRFTGYRPLVFHLPFWTGVAFGVVSRQVLRSGSVKKPSDSQVHAFVDF